MSIRSFISILIRLKFEIYSFIFPSFLSCVLKFNLQEKEFLWDGLRNIDDVLYKLYQGDTINKRVSERAKELFQQAFHIQVEQKKGNVSMKRSGGKDKSKNRQKFSRRKQFVVTCLSKALEEANIGRWKIEGMWNLLIFQIKIILTINRTSFIHCCTVVFIWWQFSHFRDKIEISFSFRWIFI